MDGGAGAQPSPVSVDGTLLVDIFEPLETSQIYVEDTVVEVSKLSSRVGIVERTHEDVDSHAPRPQADYPGNRIVSAKGVSSTALRRFLRDGIPPKNMILVRWQGIPSVELTLVSNTRLADRALLLGDMVKRDAKSTVSGTVTKVHMSCTAMHTIYHGPTVDTQKLSIPPVHALRDVPAQELELPTRYAVSMAVVYDDWAGRINYVEKEVTLRLQNGTVVVVEDPGDLEATGGMEDLEVGDFVRTRKANLRRGRWIFGAFDANAEPVGQIVETRPTALEISWLAPKPGTDKPQPPSLLDADVLNTDAVRCYDFARPDRDGTTYSSPDYGPGDLVRWRDPATAEKKYAGSGNLVRLSRVETLGYDINTFCIMVTHTKVQVRWQDGTVSTEPSTSLVPDPNIDDDDEIWPGEIVVTREARDGDNESWSFIPAKVGVVQSVNSADRIARIRWWQNSTVQYFREAGDGEEVPDEPGLVPGSTLNNLAETDEEVSLYDVRPAIGLNKRLGDFCVISSEANVPRAVDSGSEQGIDWFGEVIALGLDGMLTVRLGLESEVRDVQVRPEHLFLIIRSDMAHDFESPSIGDDEDDELRDADDYSIHGWQHDDEGLDVSVYTGSDYSSDVSSSFYETMEYQGNGGERIPGDGGDDAWSTESEDGNAGDVDTPMTDIKPSPGPTTAKHAVPESENQNEATPPGAAADASLGVSGHPNSPPPFMILDGPIPTSQHFHDTQQSTSTSSLRRVMKEHKILRKDGALPEGVFVRTWESRLDLLRVLFIGPLETPYMLAPFVIDLHLGDDFPRNPPEVFFHSWTNGSGPVNPNLYEDGKVCLSLLGTWSGEPTENWDPEKSTTLQILVSLLGLVLVKEPYFNEAGYEVRIGSEDAKIPSALYSERTYLRSRSFILHALQHPVDGFADDITWLYLSGESGAPKLLQRTIDAAKRAISTSESAEGRTGEKDGFNVISAGAVVKLRRQIADLEACATPPGH